MDLPLPMMVHAKLTTHVQAYTNRLEDAGLTHTATTQIVGLMQPKLGNKKGNDQLWFMTMD